MVCFGMNLLKHGVDTADKNQYPNENITGSISEGYADVFACF